MPGSDDDDTVIESNRLRGFTRDQRWLEYDLGARAGSQLL